jgi:hypothetical protein
MRKLVLCTTGWPSLLLSEAATPGPMLCQPKGVQKADAVGLGLCPSNRRPLTVRTLWSSRRRSTPYGHNKRENNMSNCPHCNQTTFEIEEVEASGRKITLVQCTGCKAPLGIMEHTDVGQLVQNLEQRITEVLRVLVTSLQKMNVRLDQIERSAGS